MHRPLIAGIIALASLGSAAGQASAQNLLANPSFESPVTSDGAPFIGSWEAFAGGGAAGSGNSTNTPRTGAQSLEMNIVAQNNAFAGAFQEVTGLVVGTPAVFSGFHMTPNAATLGVASEYRIEWFSGTGATAVSMGATPNVTVGPLSDQYTPFSVTGIVPVGVNTARVVYAIQSFGGEPFPGDTGTVRIDDVSFIAVVPEPTTLAALGAAGLVFGRRRR